MKDLGQDFYNINTLDDLREYFRYHPVKTVERQKAHDLINESAYRFAEIVFRNVKNPLLRLFSFFAIQQARMYANQGATIDELEQDKE